MGTLFFLGRRSITFHQILSVSHDKEGTPMFRDAEEVVTGLRCWSIGMQVFLDLETQGRVSFTLSIPVRT